VLLQRWADLGKVERSEEYRFWLVRHLQQTLGPQLGDEAFPEVGGVVYPVLIHEAATPEQPFTHEPAKDGLLSPLRDPGEVVYVSGRPQAPDWITSDTQRRYFELLVASQSVRRWNMRGFALQSLELDERGRVIGSTSTLSTYGENCLTSHVLGYELMTHFVGEEECVRPELQYCEQAKEKSLCFSIEQGFYPLISVQALVVIKGRRDDWTALVMQRSQDVAAAAGFWQFPPAGGFEILGSEDEDAFVVRRQFDLRQALIREFLEEVYGDDDLTSAADVNPELVGSPGYRLVMDAIEDGQLTIHLLGVVTDLVSLRPEFSFLIVIDDPDLRKREYQTETGNWARWLRRSSEAKRIFVANSASW